MYIFCFTPFEVAHNCLGALGCRKRTEWGKKMTELEKLCRAKLYIDNLAQGIDPISGKEIVDDSVVNHVRVSRCLYYVSEIIQNVIEQNRLAVHKPKKQKFAITAQQLSRVHPAEHPLRITEFADLLYHAVDEPGMQKPGTSMMTEWLQMKGFLQKERQPDGDYCRVPTEAGRRIGIFSQHRRGKYGEYLAIYYDTSAQQFLLDNFWAIMGKSE